jgi:sphingomyelin phosphodiesterase
MKFSNIAGLVVVVLPIFTSGLGLSETTSNALSAYGKRSTVSTILADIEDAATCVACEV